jgi:hypothetical protein
MPAAQSIPTVNNATLSLTASAGATNTSVTIGTGTGFSANDSTNRTYDIDVGPALTNLATAMTGATPVGFLKKTGQDTYSIDTNTYLTSFTEIDTLALVTGRGNTTTTDISIANLILNNAANRTISTPAVTGTNSAGRTLTVSSGPGTGTGAVSTIAFQTPTVGTTGTTTQSMATRLLLNSTGAAVTGELSSTGNVGIGTNNPLGRLHLVNTAIGNIARMESTGGANLHGLYVGIGNASDGTTLDNYITFQSSGSDAGGFTWGTGNTERIRLTPTGNVGIGTSSPTSRLSVSGGNVLFTKDGHTTGSDNFSLELFSPILDGIREVSIRFHQSGRWYHQIRSSGSGFRFTQGNNTNLVDLIANNVNIASDLVHDSDTDTKITMTDDAISIQAGGEEFIKITEDGTQDIIKLGDGGDIDVNLNDDVFVQGSDGNVGIGTIAPTAKLHVVGDTILDGTLTVTNIISADDSQVVINPSSYVSISTYGMEGISPFIQLSSDEIILNTDTVTRMRILPDGNIGIGTDTPSAKLDVAGDIEHTGLTMTSGTNVDQLKETTFTSALTTAWTDVTGVSGTYLATGSHIVQIISNGEYYTGTLSWFSGTTTSTVVDEIVLHRAGPAASAGRIFARVIRTSSAPSTLKLQVSGSASISSHTMTFKFRRTI